MRVLSSSMNVQDITSQYVDTAARLATHRAAKAQLEQLLEKSSTVQDAMSVHRELVRVTETIERLTAEKQRLEKRVSSSTLYINLQLEPEPWQPSDREGPHWDFARVWAAAVRRLELLGLASAEAAVTFTVVGVPVGLAVGLGLYIIALGGLWAAPTVARWGQHVVQAVHNA